VIRNRESGHQDIWEWISDYQVIRHTLAGFASKSKIVNQQPIVNNQ